MEYQVILREINSSREIVRNVSLMTTKHKDRAVRFFNEKVASLSYFPSDGRELMLVAHGGEKGSEVIRESLG